MMLLLLFSIFHNHHMGKGHTEDGELFDSLALHPAHTKNPSTVCWGVRAAAPGHKLLLPSRAASQSHKPKVPSLCSLSLNFGEAEHELALALL